MCKSLDMQAAIVLFLIAAILLLGAATAEALPLATNGVPNSANLHNLAHNPSATRIVADQPALGGTDEVCVFCHTPHGASAQSSLWNRRDPGGTFVLYNSATLVIDSGQAQTDSQYGPSYPDGYPNGASRMCMSCHDGITANFGEVVNAPNATGGGTSIAMLSGTFNAGANLGNLADVHPVSFIYNGTVKGLIEAVKGLGTYQLPSVSYVTLDGKNRMQCTTCHDPHEDTKGDQYVSLPFWRYKNAASENAAYDSVCAACHVGSAPFNTDHGTKDPSVYP